MILKWNERSYQHIITNTSTHLVTKYLSQEAKAQDVEVTEDDVDDDGAGLPPLQVQVKGPGDGRDGEAHEEDHHRLAEVGA